MTTKGKSATRVAVLASGQGSTFEALVEAGRRGEMCAEVVLLIVIYDVPSRDEVAQVIITAEVVKESVLPTLVPREKLAKRERRDKSA